MLKLIDNNKIYKHFLSSESTTQLIIINYYYFMWQKYCYFTGSATGGVAGNLPPKFVGMQPCTFWRQILVFY